MAAPPNCFSLLVGEEGEFDFDRLTAEAKEAKLLSKEKIKAARLAAKEKAVKEEEEVDKDQYQNPHSRQSDNGSGRNGEGHGKEYQGRVPRSNGKAVGRQLNGYQQKQGPFNGFHHDNRQSGGSRGDNRVGDGVAPSDGFGFRGNNRRSDGYQPNYGRNNGYQGNDECDYQGNRTVRDGCQGNYRSRDYQGEGNGYSYKGNYKERNGYDIVKHDDANQGNDQSQIRGSQSEDGWSPYYRRYNGGGRRDFNRGHYRNKSQASEGNVQPVNDGDDEWKPKTDEQGDKKEAGEQVSKTPEAKEVEADCDAVSVVASEVSEEAKSKQKKVNGNVNKHWSEMTEEEKKAVRAKRAEERAKEIEEDEKLLTLEQYEKIRLEKKKALLEASKTEERKVSLDKDLNSMQPIHKKKEDVSFVEPHSEKDQFKKKNSLGKDEKAVESIIIKELFMNSAAGGRKFERRGGQFEGRRFDGRNTRNWGRKNNGSVVDGVKLEDESEFPVLGGST